MIETLDSAVPISTLARNIQQRWPDRPYEIRTYIVRAILHANDSQKMHEAFSCDWIDYNRTCSTLVDALQVLIDL